MYFYLLNRLNGDRFGRYKTVEAARRGRDRKDNQYGAYIWSVQSAPLEQS